MHGSLISGHLLGCWNVPLSQPLCGLKHCITTQSPQCKGTLLWQWEPLSQGPLLFRQWTLSPSETVCVFWWGEWFWTTLFGADGFWQRLHSRSVQFCFLALKKVIMNINILNKDSHLFFFFIIFKKTIWIVTCHLLVCWIQMDNLGFHAQCQGRGQCRCQGQEN